MTFTVADVILDVREGMSDSLIPYRYDDAFVVRRVNQVLRRICVVRPDLFTVHAPITCVAGILQSCPADSMRLFDVVSNDDGQAVKEVNQDTLDLMVPTWSAQTSTPITNWMRYPRDPNRFYVYPPAAGTETLNIVYARSPAALMTNQTVPLPDAYMPAVIDGTMWLMESIDAEHVESPRAAAFKDAFESALTAGLTVRRLTDVDAGGLPKEEVL
jgi:hypothetical protein